MTKPTETRTGTRVLRWQITADDQWHAIGPGDVVHVACRPGDELGTVHVWTLETGPVLPTRYVRVFGTGHYLPTDARAHLGTGITADGSLVWHVFEHKP